MQCPPSDGAAIADGGPRLTPSPSSSVKWTPVSADTEGAVHRAPSGAAARGGPARLLCSEVRLGGNAETITDPSQDEPPQTAQCTLQSAESDVISHCTVTGAAATVQAPARPSAGATDSSAGR